MQINLTEGILYLNALALNLSGRDSRSNPSRSSQVYISLCTHTYITYL